MTGVPCGNGDAGPKNTCSQVESWHIVSKGRSEKVQFQSWEQGSRENLSFLHTRIKRNAILVKQIGGKVQRNSWRWNSNTITHHFGMNNNSKLYNTKLEFCRAKVILFKNFDWRAKFTSAMQINYILHPTYLLCRLRGIVLEGAKPGRQTALTKAEDKLSLYLIQEWRWAWASQWLTSSKKWICPLPWASRQVSRQQGGWLSFSHVTGIWPSVLPSKLNKKSVQVMREDMRVVQGAQRTSGEDSRSTAGTERLIQGLQHRWDRIHTRRVWRESGENHCWTRHAFLEGSLTFLCTHVSSNTRHRSTQVDSSIHAATTRKTNKRVK